MQSDVTELISVQSHCMGVANRATQLLSFAVFEVLLANSMASSSAQTSQMSLFTSHDMKSLGESKKVVSICVKTLEAPAFMCLRKGQQSIKKCAEGVKAFFWCLTVESLQF